MLKKLTMSLIIVFTIISTYVFAAEVREEKIKILNELKITDQINTFKEQITVNEFIYSIANMLSEEHIEMDKAADYLMERRINVSQDELSSNITYERALAIAIKAMGYTPYVNETSDESAEYLRVASLAGITKGVTGKVGEPIETAECIDLIFNMTDASLPDVDMGTSGFVYEIDEERTMLSYYKNIRIIEGVVNATYNTALNDKGGVSDNEILIGDRVFNIEPGYDTFLLGCYVKAYVYDLYGEDIVLYVAAEDDVTEIIDVDVSYFPELEKDYKYIEYELEGKTKKVKIDPAFDVIYNGRFYADYTREELIPKEGSIRLVDTNGDELFDIIHVTSYESMIAWNISSIYKTISNRYTYKNAVEDLDLSDEDITLKIYRNGTPATIGKLIAGDVLSIARSKGENPLVVIYASNKRVDGRATNYDDEEKTVIVGENEYKVSSLYYDAKKEGELLFVDFDYSSSQEFFLDAFGKIAYVSEVKNGGFKYAYLLKLKHDDFQEHFFMRVLKEDGEWETLTMKDKLRLNDGVNAKSSIVFERMGGTLCQPQLIMIKTNNDNLVTAIKTAGQYIGYEPNKFTGTTWQTREWKSQNNALESTHYIKEDSVVFVVPRETEDTYNEDEYRVTGAGFFQEWKTYTYCAYNISQFSKPDVFVSYEPPQGFAAKRFFVDSIDVALNEDDEAVMRLKGDMSGVEDLAIAENEYGIIKAAGIEPGQVVLLQMNEDKILSATVEVDARTKKVVSNPTNYTDDIKYMGYAKAIDVLDSMILIDFKSEGERALEVSSSAMIEIYDSEEKTFVSGSLKDISRGDYVVCICKYAGVNAVVVYKQ